MSSPGTPVIYVLTQSGALANGGVSSLSQVITHLQHHRPIVVTDQESDRVGEWRRAGIETHVIPQAASSGLFRNPIAALRSYWRYMRELRRLIKSSGAKVVHANDPAAFQLAVAAAKLRSAKLVFNVRGTFDPDQPPSRVKYWMLFALADHILYLSHEMANRWRTYVPNADTSCSVTYSVVDLARFHPGPCPRESVVLVSGLIRPLKGQLEFIRDAVPRLAAKGVRVWFAGDLQRASGSYMGACAEAAAPFGDNVQFLGYRTDIADLVASSTVIAVTSRHEGLARTMIEGMSCARPVVSFDVCSAREVLEKEAGGAGTVVSCGDFAAMAEAILTYCCDGGAAAAAGERGRATAERLFSADEVIARYERAYRMLEKAG